MLPFGSQTYVTANATTTWLYCASCSAVGHSVQFAANATTRWSSTQASPPPLVSPALPLSAVSPPSSVPVPAEDADVVAPESALVPALALDASSLAVEPALVPADASAPPVDVSSAL